MSVKRARTISAAVNSSTSSWKSNQRLARLLQRKPADDLKILSVGGYCHGFDLAKHPEHNCLAYENEKRAARGAPPLDPSSD